MHRAADYRRVYRRGSAWNHPFFTLRSLRLSCSDADLLPPDIRLGIVTGKRVGSSVVRNRVKRILREIGRRALREALEPRDFVIIARAPIVGHSSGEIERALRDLLRRAALL